MRNENYKDMDKIKEWFDWLTNKETKLENISTKSPNLSKNKAFNILYALQEYLGIVSDEIEMCKDCKTLCDMASGEGDCANEEYKEFGLARKPREYEEGIYCENCLRRRFGFKSWNEK